MKSVLSASMLSMAILLAGCIGNYNYMPAGSPDTAAGPAPFTVKIIGLNDFQGNLESQGAYGQTAVAADKPPVGGAEYLAGHIARLKARNPMNVVVGAGYLIGASPMISALFHDEPTIEAMNRAGLEFSSVGNHEFDKGSAELMRRPEGGGGGM